MQQRGSSPVESDNQDSVAALLDALRPDGALARLLAGAARLSAEPKPAIAGDILYGADAIAEFLFGDGRQRRRVYALVETGSLPHFRLGASICARRSVLLEWMATQESGALRSPRTPELLGTFSRT